jgi:hypothetical protein
LKVRVSRRGTVGGLAGVAIATALALFLTVAAPADPPRLTLAATSAVAGQAIHATAVLSESPNAAGEISFEVFGPGDQTCSGPPLAPAPAPASVNGEGEYASGEVVPPAAGTYHWSASYSGDLENPPAESPCSAVSSVEKANPALTGSASNGAVGTAIHDQATVTGGVSPTGELTFSVYGPADAGCSTPLETVTVPLQGGHATSTDFIPPQAGEFRWTVEYTGDANNEAAPLGCGAPNQASAVGKASPTLSGTATSATSVSLPITDNVTLSGGFSPGDQLVFRAFGPSDPACAGAARYQATVPVSGNRTYSPPGFAPGAGLYLWTAEYTGDANNEAALLGCGAPNQASAVGTISVTMGVAAGSGAVGSPVSATATIQEGATPAGQITFKAFPPGDTTCAGAAAFSSTVSVAGNGRYRSGAFVPARVGTFRWTVGYSGDANHVPATAACGKATSNVTQAQPSIAGAVKQRLTVGTPFQDTATLKDGYTPGGTITFRIFGPVAAGCAKPAFVDTVAAAGNGSVSSDPFVAKRPGRYSFVASYSGDSANKGVTEPCDSAAQVVRVQKRMPRVRPRARLIEDRRISIRAHLSGGVSPSGTITFRLYRPGDGRCTGKPAFSGGITVTSNGNFSLAQYLAPKPGTYRLSVGYSGDLRNRRYKGSCGGAQAIHVG